MFLLAASMASFCYINVPTAEMRQEPKNGAEIESQAYFSEEVTPMEQFEEWIKIETKVDHDVGWIKKSAICKRDNPFLGDPGVLIAMVNRLAAHLYSTEDTIFGPIMTLPFESRVEVIDPKDNSNSRWLKVALPDGTIAFIQRGDISLNPPLLPFNQICEFSQRFLGLPYTWGGRSSFGYDCSGFVQMLYRQAGVYLPRNSRDQIRWEGFKVITLEELKPGDLIFFGLAADKIRHVGLYLGDDRFIHATVAENAPYIHISNLKDSDWNGSGKLTFRAARTLAMPPKNF